MNWNLSFGPLTSYIQKVLYMSETRSAKAFDKFLAGYLWFKSSLSAFPYLWAICTFKYINSLLHKTVLTAFVFCCWYNFTSAWGVLHRSWVNKEFIVFQTSQERELWTFANLNLAIVYLRAKREQEFAALLERINPESLPSHSHSLRAAAYYVQGLQSFFQARYNEAK